MPGWDRPTVVGTDKCPPIEDMFECDIDMLTDGWPPRLTDTPPGCPMAMLVGTDDGCCMWCAKLSDEE